MQITRVSILCTACLMLVVGCAYGFERPAELDAGFRRRDSGRFDGGPRLDGGPQDAGSEAGNDSGPSCDSHQDCSDSLTCNGQELCIDRHCVAGTPVVCDDGVTCTTERCEEPGSCEVMLDDSRCPSGQSCRRTGCIDGTPTCEGTPCGLVSPQCGCPSGQGCYLTTGGRTCAAAGTRREGDACARISDCIAGFACFDRWVEGIEKAGMCARYCQSDRDCQGAGSLCVYSVESTVRICSRACDPVRQTGCDTGFSCSPFLEIEAPRRGFTDCIAPVGTGRSGSLCASESDCAAGYGCMLDRCAHWCNVGTGEGCTGAERCTRFSETVLIGTTEYGYCS